MWWIQTRAQRKRSRAGLKATATDDDFIEAKFGGKTPLPVVRVVTTDIIRMEDVLNFLLGKRPGGYLHRILRESGSQRIRVSRAALCR
jgi:hypothetical protein